VADVLQPTHVPFDVDPDSRQRVEALIAAPAQEDTQVRLTMLPGQAEVGGHRRAQHELTRGRDPGAGDRERSHTSPCVTSNDEHQNSRRGYERVPGIPG
jgi:hypothetical protein